MAGEQLDSISGMMPLNNPKHQKELSRKKKKIVWHGEREILPIFGKKREDISERGGKKNWEKIPVSSFQWRWSESFLFQRWICQENVGLLPGSDRAGQGQERDLTILMCPFPLGVFYDSVTGANPKNSSPLSLQRTGFAPSLPSGWHWDSRDRDGGGSRWDPQPRPDWARGPHRAQDAEVITHP